MVEMLVALVVLKADMMVVPKDLRKDLKMVVKLAV